MNINEKIERINSLAEVSHVSDDIIYNEKRTLRIFLCNGLDIDTVNCTEEKIKSIIGRTFVSMTRKESIINRQHIISVNYISEGKNKTKKQFPYAILFGLIVLVILTTLILIVFRYYSNSSIQPPVNMETVKKIIEENQDYSQYGHQNKI
jgi:hypothetical protein